MTAPAVDEVAAAEGTVLNQELSPSGSPASNTGAAGTVAVSQGSVTGTVTVNDAVPSVVTEVLRHLLFAASMAKLTVVEPGPTGVTEIVC